MNKSNLSDLRLIGTTEASGGRFALVKITGEAVLAGDTECRHISCVGNVEVRGNLKAGSFRLTGECRVTGDLISPRIRAIGEIRLDGSIRGDSVTITGGVRVQGSCEAERLQVEGAVTVEELLSAEEVDLRLHGRSRVKEIGGGIVTVKKSRAAKVKSLFASGGSAGLSADLIEGDTVVLEHTQALVVRGNRVTIGSGCEIGRVEYRDTLKVGTKAQVKEQVKL